jgi:hypothetical protein
VSIFVLLFTKNIKADTPETLTPLIEKQREGFIIVGKNVRCDIDRKGRQKLQTMIADH